MGMVITGKIVSGVKQGAFFTQLDWVQEQCLEKLGFEPYPGTLNLEIAEEKLSIIEALLQRNGIDLIPPNSNFCLGQAVAVSVGGKPAAIVLPAEEVRIHAKNIIEIISYLKLKDALNVDDGDYVTLRLEASAEKD
jgi:CTP-dependent riboflavin kinase